MWADVLLFLFGAMCGATLGIVLLLAFQFRADLERLPDDMPDGWVTESEATEREMLAYDRGYDSCEALYKAPAKTKTRKAKREGSA